MDSDKKKQTIKMFIAISVLVLVFITVAIMMIKYEVEGEQNMPFNLSKMVVISTAEGVENSEKSKTKWDLNICQNNDVYIYFDKNENYKKDEIIEKVVIDNIKVLSEPKKGTVKVYMPNSSNGSLYENSDEYLVEDKLQYTGASQSNSKTLEVGSKGGEVLIRFSNTNIGNYKSDKDSQIVHDGSIIGKTDATYEDIQFKVSFDLSIQTSKVNYKANIVLDLPTGNIIEEKTSNLEINDTSNIIFKRSN